MKCRICGNEVSLIEKILKCNAEQFTVAKKPFQATEVDISMYSCPNCSHFQTEYILEDNFYDTYEPNQGASQYSGDLNQFEDKIKKIAKRAPKKKYEIEIFEIGSGTGSVLKTAKKYFSKCVGVEPSFIEFNIAQKDKIAGIEFYNTYFDEKINIGSNYSAFMSFQVFEHLQNPYIVLQAAHDRLVPGGVGLINVPNGLRIINDVLYHQIIVQHINYFTAFSLAYMAHNVGFDVLEIESNESTIEYDLYVRKKTMEHNSFNKMKESHKADINEYLKKYKHICIWGAGAKSSKYIRLLEHSDFVEYVVDSSFEKNGLFINRINKPIAFPQKKIFDACDAIIIFASSYNKEIISELRNRYDYKKDIICFDNNQLVLDQAKE